MFIYNSSTINLNVKSQNVHAYISTTLETKAWLMLVCFYLTGPLIIHSNNFWGIGFYHFYPKVYGKQWKKNSTCDIMFWAGLDIKSQYLFGTDQDMNVALSIKNVKCTDSWQWMSAQVQNVHLLFDQIVPDSMKIVNLIYLSRQSSLFVIGTETWVHLTIQFI